jgi:hypothetical protein
VAVIALLGRFHLLQLALGAWLHRAMRCGDQVSVMNTRDGAPLKGAAFLNVMHEPSKERFMPP